MKKVYKNAEIKGKITDFIVEDGRFSFIGKVEEDGSIRFRAMMLEVGQ